MDELSANERNIAGDASTRYATARANTKEELLAAIGPVKMQTAVDKLKNEVHGQQQYATPRAEALDSKARLLCEWPDRKFKEIDESWDGFKNGKPKNATEWASLFRHRIEQVLKHTPR